jgi:thioester reductase-like protein
MASTHSTTPEDRFTALEVSNHNIQLKLEEYHEEVSRLRNDMETLTKVVAQLICDNNEVFDEALAKLCQTSTVHEYQTQFEQLAA